MGAASGPSGDGSGCGQKGLRRAGTPEPQAAGDPIGAQRQTRTRSGEERRAGEETCAGEEARAGQEAPPATLDDLAGIVAAQVRAQTRRIAELELALADAQARILSQARLICTATLAADGDLFSRRPVREIVEDVLAGYPGIRWEEIIGVGRERRLVEPRHRCMSAVYQERPDLSLPALGRIFHRDHTSVLHAVNKREPGEEPHENPHETQHRARTRRPDGPLAAASDSGIGVRTL
ncbi:hypothetical protein BBX50_25560 [Ensifer sp. LC11]|nr:hypothetical protein BBX50_25560 [Ensifer sp. LC11]